MKLILSKKIDKNCFNGGYFIKLHEGLIEVLIFSFHRVSSFAIHYLNLNGDILIIKHFIYRQLLLGNKSIFQLMYTLKVHNFLMTYISH